MSNLKACGKHPTPTHCLSRGEWDTSLRCATPLPAFSLTPALLPAGYSALNMLSHKNKKLTCPPPPLACFFSQQPLTTTPSWTWMIAILSVTFLSKTTGHIISTVNRPTANRKKQVLDTKWEFKIETNTIWVHLNFTCRVGILRDMFIKMLHNGLLRAYKSAMTRYFFEMVEFLLTLFSLAFTFVFL